MGRDGQRERESESEAHTLWPEPKMGFRCNCGRKICGSKVIIPGRKSARTLPASAPSCSAARTAEQRAVSAVSLFYYAADKQSTWLGLGPIVRASGLRITVRRTGLGLGVRSLRVLRTLSRSPASSLERPALWAEQTPPLEAHTHSGTVHIYRCGELDRFPIRFGNLNPDRRRTRFPSLLPTLPWHGAQRFGFGGCWFRC